MVDEAGTVAGGCWIFLHARTGCVLTLTIFLRIAKGDLCIYIYMRPKTMARDHLSFQTVCRGKCYSAYFKYCMFTLINCKNCIYNDIIVDNKANYYVYTIFLLSMLW